MRWTSLLVSSLVLVSACGQHQSSSIDKSNDDPVTSVPAPSSTVLLPGPVDALDGPGDSHMVAVRVDPPDHADPQVVASPVGLWGLPFAPEGLSDCDEMAYYRQQFGLPDRFQQLGWRESNCRNEEGVKTYCCYGYLQLYFTVHYADPHGWWIYTHCEVDEVSDYNGDEPLDKQKQMCAAKGLFDLLGYSPWKL